MPRLLLWILLGAGTTTGCVPFYQPTLVTTPLVRQRGQVAVSGRWHLPETGQLTAAWSPLKHLRLGAALSACHSGQATDSTDSYLRNRQYEVGAGYYLGVSQGRGVIEFGASLGQGRTFAYGKVDHDPFGFVVPVGGTGGNGSAKRRGLPVQRGQFTTVAGQVSALWNMPAAHNGQLGLALRLSRVRFTHLTLDEVSLGQPTMGYLEPAWIVRTQKKVLSLEAQFGFSVALSAEPDTRVFYAARPRLGVGLVIDPGQLFQRKEVR